MRYRTLGASGLMVSTVGLGCNAFGKTIDEEAARSVCLAALDQGITFFDTGDTYGRPDDSTTPYSESMLGRILAGHRDEVVISTKFGNDMFGLNGADWGARGARRYVRTAVERSLRQLNTDRIDLYMLHNPDPHTPIEETLSVLTDLVHEGKVLYLAASNIPAWKLTDANWIADTKGLARFVALETEYSLLHRDAERELLPACRHLGVGLLPYFPLAHGLLTGKYRGGEIPAGSRLATWHMPGYLTADRLDTVSRIERFAEARGRTILEIAIGALAATPGVGTVIAGATRAEQVAANVAAAEWIPDEAELTELAGVLAGA